MKEPAADRRCAPVRPQTHASREEPPGDNTPRPAGASQRRHIARL